MGKRIDRKRLLLALIACVLFAACGVGFGLAQTVSKVAADVVVQDAMIREEYAIGQRFTIPKAKLSDGKQTVDSEYGYLVFPNGKATDLSPVTLDQEGKYRLIYNGTIDGKAVSAEIGFSVRKQIYSVGSEKSSAKYGSHDLVQSREGIVIKLENKDVFQYNRIIDLSDNTANDVLIRFFVVPTTIGSPDVGRIKVRFTDIYDESNYVTLNFKNHSNQGTWADPQTYISAGAADQPDSGWENYPGNFSLHQGDDFGFPVWFSMTGTPSGYKKLGEEFITLYYDNAEKQIFTAGQIFSGSNMVVDLDDAEYFDSPWKGFTTGEVRMTVFGENYQASALNLVITEIDGQKPARDLADHEPPMIAVDTSGYEKNALPYALVGKEYLVFAGTAFDKYDGDCAVVTSVYYNYGTEKQTVCDVKDGVFTPKRAGTYTLVYTATDLCGNKSVEKLTVNAVAESGLSVVLKGAVTEGATGESVRLLESVNVSNPSGNVTYTVSAVDGENSYEVDAKTFLFRPTKDGEYKIIVRATDYVKTVEKLFTFIAWNNDTPYIYDEVTLPHYFIKGASYTLPTLCGYDFSSGTGERKTAEIFIRENGGAEKAVPSVYVPSAEGTVTVGYRLEVNGKRAEKTYSVPVIDVGYGGTVGLEKYFVAKSGSLQTEATEGYVTLKTTKNTNVEFINTVQVKSFTFTFNVNAEKNNFNAINVYLTDTQDGAKQVKFTYAKQENGSRYSINDGTVRTIGATFFGGKDNFMLNFDASTNVANASASVGVKVTTFTDGSAFTGFTNNTAYLTVEFVGVSGESELFVYNINRQSFTDFTRDNRPPQIVVSPLIGDRTKDEILTFGGALAADVLDSRCEFSFSITDPNGNYVRAENGVLLNGTDNDPTATYDVKLTVYGDYTITYRATDSHNNPTDYTYGISVLDNVAPTVEILSPKTSAKRGETVKIASLSVKDNVTETSSVFICVEGPDFVHVTVENNGFKADKAGVYKISYMVSDEAGNYTFASYTVTVK